MEWKWALVALLLVSADAVPLRGDAPVSSYLELETRTGWSGWAPKMKASFDIETHAWKPPWFRDGVEGVYIEPFPSYLWLKNGLAIPLTDADKYIFTKDEATQAEDEQKSTKHPDDEDKDQVDPHKEEKPEDNEQEPEVDGVPVPRAKEQYEQMRKFDLDPKMYTPGSLVGQKVFNEWWNSVHTKESSPSMANDVKDEIKSWFFPHFRDHMSQVKDNWLGYFEKLIGVEFEADKTVHAPAQNTDSAGEARRDFFYKRMPSGECVNIGSGVLCNPIVMDRDLHPLDQEDPVARAAIARASNKVRSTMGMRVENHEAFDKEMRQKELNSRKLMLTKRKNRRRARK